MLGVNTNVTSQVAINALAQNEQRMSTAMNRLSTGVRINSASDDAAGLKVASRMTAQINGLEQAVTNATHAISMVETTEGGIREISNMLHRMRELAVAAQNGTNHAKDIDAMQAEFEQLQDEIERIADNTQYNGINVLNSGADRTFAIGALGESLRVNLFDFQTKHAAVTYATADVTNGSDKFTKANHGFSNGDAVVYNHGGGAVAAGLTDGTTYYVTEISGNDFKLATSYDNAVAGTVQAITGDGNDAQTLTKVTAYGGNIDKTTISVNSTTNAATALTAIDKAIAGTDGSRASLGAALNRLNYAVSSLGNTKVNAEASRSRILDTDYGAVTAELARTQIIAQAGVAMLAQANMKPQSVLALLKS